MIQWIHPQKPTNLAIIQPRAAVIVAGFLVAFVVGGQVAVGVADAVFAEDFGVGVVICSVVDGDAARAIGPEGDAGVAEVVSVLTKDKIRRLTRTVNDRVHLGADAGYDPAPGGVQREPIQQLDLNKNVLGRYERDQAKPSIEQVLKIADVFNVSMDYLTGKIDDTIEPKLIKQMIALQQLPQKEREHILFAIEALVRDTTTRLSYTS